MLIQKLRLQRGWSQSQLAEIAGLSTRTIQRLETGKGGSLESYRALAAVFEVDFNQLQSENQPMNLTATPPTAESGAVPNESMSSRASREEREAFEYVQGLRGFYFHLTLYLVVVGSLFVFNLWKSPKNLWSLWVMFGWGIGVLSHGVRYFQPKGLLGPEWERRQVEKRLGRKLSD